VATEFRYASYFWGPHGIGYGNTRALFGAWISRHVDVVFKTEAGTQFVIASLGVAAIGLVLGRFGRVAAALALFSSLLLEGRLPELLDGGDNITRIVLLYMLFLLPATASPRPRSFAVFVHNVAILAIGLQLGTLYLTSGFMKASGTRWNQGTALYLVSQVEWFSLPSSRWIFRNPFVTTAATYGTIFFQLWFPIAVFSRLKGLWIAAGIGIHLGIALTMGLVPFSTVMIGLELFLITDSEWRTIATWLKRQRTRLISTGVLRRLSPVARPTEETS